MILLVCFILGLSLRMAIGLPIADLGKTRLTGEAVLVLLLVLQALLPLIKASTPGVSVIAFWSWLVTFPIMIALAWVNRSRPGMWVLGAGLLMNFIVIAANQGMPVMPSALWAIAGRPTPQIPVSDFVHVIGSRDTLLPWLADAIPIARGYAAIASPGDCLLWAGLVAFIGADSDSRTHI